MFIRYFKKRILKLSHSQIFILFPLLPFLLTGCITVGPDYEKPDTAVTAAWSQALMKDFSGEEPALQSYWKVYEDELLNTIIDKATVGNLNLKVALARIQEARALRGIAKGELFPEIDGTGAAFRTRQGEETIPDMPSDLDRNASFFQGGVSVDWELDLWGRIRRSIESADATQQARIEDYRDTLVLLYADVASNYIEVRALQARITYAKNNIAAQKETVQLTQNRNSAGLAPDLDVSQAELNLAQTEARISPLRSALAQTIHRLGILTGEPPDALYTELEASKNIPVPPEKTAVGLPVNLLRQRPDIRRFERELASQHARIGVAKAALYPTFTLPGSFVMEATVFDKMFNADNLAFEFGPSFRWNLFAGGRIRSAIRVEEARTQQALNLYQQTVLDALEEVENAMVDLSEERMRVASLKRAVTAADKSVQLVKTLYRSGLTDFQNVLDMQRELTEQQDNLAASKGRLAQNFVQLYRALGGGWTTAEE